MSNCTVKFYKDSDFDGRHKSYDGARLVSDLSDVHWEDHDNDNLSDDISSVETGSQAWVRLYSEENYGGRTALIGPSRRVNMSSIYDDHGDGAMNDAAQSFQLLDRAPEVDTSRITKNFVALYPGSNHNRKDNLYNVEFYSQDVKYRIYEPTLTFGTGKLNFTINLDHVQLEKDDHAVVTFSMDFKGNFVDSIKVEYTMADATQIPDWVIKLVDGAIEASAIVAKIIADGTEIIITDGIGVVAVVETNQLIDLTAEALTFCVDHLNTVLSAVFLYQDDGGTTYFPAVVSQAIARAILAYYQELWGQDTNPKMTFHESTFLGHFGKSTWDTSKSNPLVQFSIGNDDYRSYFPDNTFFYAKGGALSSVKIDSIEDGGKDDHLAMQAAFGPNGQLICVVGAIDIFDRTKSSDYKAPTSGLIMYDKNHQMVQITNDGVVHNINYASLQDAYQDLLTKALTNNGATYGINISSQQKTLVTASSMVLDAIQAAVKS